MNFTLVQAGATRPLAVRPAGADDQAADGRFRISDGDREVEVDARPLGRGGWSLLVGGRSHLAQVHREGTVYTVEISGRSFHFQLTDPAQAILPAAGSHGHGPGQVKAPMPGRVVRILVKAGQQVSHGDGIIVVEAMKMENELSAPRDGQVEEIHVAEGETVEGNAPLVTIGDLE